MSDRNDGDRKWGGGGGGDRWIKEFGPFLACINV